MTKIGIILGSTRPGRRGQQVAEWVAEVAAKQQDDVTYEIVDVADFDLPLLDEEQPALFGTYGKDHTRRWAETIASYDGFVFVTAEYNHSVPGALKNALDYLFAEWHHKPAGFVSYGLHGGTRAVEHLRLILAELKVPTVRTQVVLSIFNDFTMSAPTETGSFTPGAHNEPTLVTMLGEIVAWSTALESLRSPALV
ncbi:NAD(P)H-dependent oxidoreductase [Micromonospora sp. NPDC049274]|uniref:NADPH-dependent FMN reductase n=1 Tax=Micromonospora sp. NPDC049274 TaxID=3154829 RepID=UPI00344A785C